MAWQGFGWKTKINESTVAVEPEGSKDGLLKFIDEDVIGKGAIFEGPYGCRRILYTDYVASGKALHSIEQFIQEHVLPTYANTHTHSTVTSAQTTCFRDEAKEIIRKTLGTNKDDVIIFTGSGVTGAVHKLIQVLNLKTPPVVFCGPFEHHSNLLPWREMNSHVVNISETTDGNVNLRHLEIALTTWENSGRPLIGSFSAASNITGITTDARKVSALLHKYGAIFLWDYATGAPYLDIQMHPEPLNGYDASKDAVFISMHKFVGSPDAPGLLVASKHLFQNPVPSIPGGGTVLFVFENDHRYLKDIESREEGGTPSIIGSIRAGMAFKLKMAVGTETIMKRETKLYDRAMQVWKDVPELEILGALEAGVNVAKKSHKLAIFSFLIRHSTTRLYLHYNYVTTLLNDLFGIQTRGGCACAGVYAQHLLGINRVAERRFGGALVGNVQKTKSPTGQETERTEYEILRPGFTRLNFPYFMSDEDADFIINAVVMVAKHGWSLLPQYQYNSWEGSWNHVDFSMELEQKSLDDVQFQHDGLHFSNATRHHSPHKLPTSKIDCLKKAERIFSSAKKIGKAVEEQRSQFSDSSVKDLRWFFLPFEAQLILKKKVVKKHDKLIFEVRRQIHELSEAEMTRDVTSAASQAGVNFRKNISPDEEKTRVFVNRNSGPAVNEHMKESANEPVQDKKKGNVLFSLRRAMFWRTKNSVDVIAGHTLPA